MEAILIEKEAMVLPEAERAVLAERLLASLESKKIAYDEEWLEESKERFEAYKAGLIKSMNGEEEVAKIRASLRK
ncbi:MAG: addiction module protein [Verrucomicrobia bacterium]|jgi:putative addiction module component (TIGR02574 family)|nr:addiction module protein [Verrucomicrobiota bacterium]|tara:strand:+ start:9813 stop:10037 length:225 start_codon:yes stop_codon:yes gene_type:complete